MNSNKFHNLSNIATMILAMATAGLVASGCELSVVGNIDCAKSWISPAYTSMAIAAIQTAKMVVNVVRDGVSGLWKPQPPVKQ